MNTNPNTEFIAADSGKFKEIHKIVAENAPLIGRLNNGWLPPEEIRALLAKITQSEIDDTLAVNLPFHCDFGRNLRIGKNVFINSGAMFTDLGGITIEDDVLIAPRANIISVNHPLEAEKRRGLHLAPVRICRNAWIGTGATILPGVTVGENAVVAAGAVVNKDVPPNTIVGGIPAKVLKTID